jgi:hypothetical protein
MDLRIIREEFATTYTIGKLYLNGEFVCYTLEDTVREVVGKPVEEWKIPKITAIPAGVYKIIVDHSNHFNKDLPHILNVPGYEGVRIHSGNKPEDTEGCILVGYVWPGNGTILNSKAALDYLQPKIVASKVTLLQIG